MLRMLVVLVAIGAVSFGQRRPAQPRTLDIYWIDVEGGAATLIVSPTGESLLVDTGFPGDRDSQRIAQAVVTAGLSHIDHLIITHYHGDHVGGVPALVKLVTIRNFYDHGENTEDRGAQQFNDYLGIAKGKRTILKPGDKIALGDVQLTIVSAAGKVIQNRLERGFFTTKCEGAEQKPPDTTENSQSVGFLLTYNRFSFLDLGDLTWDREMQLACPVNKIGEVSLLQATHHGFSNGQSGAPALVWSLRPQVVVVNNGPQKGFSNESYDEIAKIPNIEGIWQGHRGEANDDAHNTAENMIANLSATDDKGYWIKASVAADGGFVVTNARNNFSKTYRVR
jgi:beta-lactamase superfamily II metal-dependent hydrolase